MELVRLALDSNWNIEFSVNKWLILGAALAVLGWRAYLIIIRRVRSVELEIHEATLGIGNSTIKLRPNIEDAQVAYKLWVELTTRKIGLPIDPENDVITEVYDSRHDSFAVTRQLIKTIPVGKLRENEGTREIVRIAVEVLNRGLRPHLTKWQAKFRRWYDAELCKPEHAGLPPQQIQKTYPAFEDLVAEMLATNQKIIAFAKPLRNIAMGNK